MAASVARVVVAGASSGSGKTVFTLGLLAALRGAGLTPAALKCGPDYIDGQFHRVALGRPGHNLDLCFTDAPRARALLARAARGCDVAVVEGVMGLYDGVGVTENASTYDVARATSSPVLLVVDAKGSSLTAAAVAQGLARFRPDANVAGVVLNRCSRRRMETLAPAIQEACGARVVGCLPQDADAALPSRHLGLVGASEVRGLEERVGRLGALVADNVDLDAVMAIARSAPAIGEEPFASAPLPGPTPTVAVAMDEAFCFYYQENLEMLRDLGAQLAFFSPLSDHGLPQGTDALYLGGGYPELHGARLAANLPMRRAVREAVGSGLPCVAECGGFMYLQREVVDSGGTAWAMAGALGGSCRRAERLAHFGYVEVRLGRDCLYGPAGSLVPAHEFHYWRSDEEGADAVAARAAGGEQWPCAHLGPALYAGFPHVYWPAALACAHNLVRAAQRHRAGFEVGSL